MRSQILSYSFQRSSDRVPALFFFGSQDGRATPHGGWSATARRSPPRTRWGGLVRPSPKCFTALELTFSNSYQCADLELMLGHIIDVTSGWVCTGNRTVGDFVSGKT